MTAIMEFYQQQAQKNRSSIHWLAQMQEEAILAFGQTGFPTRQNEDWKYTSVEALQQQVFNAPATQDISPAYLQELPDQHQVVIHNGLIYGVEALKKHLPKGVLVLPLAQAMKQHADLVQAYLGKIVQQEHAFHFLNTAMMGLGLFIYIPPHTRLDELLVLRHFQDKDNQAVYLRHLIVADEGCQASVLEEYSGSPEALYLTNTITELHLGKKASLCHYKLQRESKAAYHLGQLSVCQTADSQFASHVISLGSKLLRSDLVIALEEPQAQCLMNGIYAPGEGQHMDHHTRVDHLVPDCQSNQDYKGILCGKSRAVFNGKVVVAKNAQHTDAAQQNKNLLLSKNAEVNTKPQLEIYADDVVCSHGATVGQLDEEALFYLATRGIDKAEATQYLIRAFAKDNVRLIAHDKLAEWVFDLISQQVG